MEYTWDHPFYNSSQNNSNENQMNESFIIDKINYEIVEEIGNTIIPTEEVIFEGNIPCNSSTKFSSTPFDDQKIYSEKFIFTGEIPFIHNGNVSNRITLFESLDLFSSFYSSWEKDGKKCEFEFNFVNEYHEYNYFANINYRDFNAEKCLNYKLKNSLDLFKDKELVKITKSKQDPFHWYVPLQYSSTNENDDDVSHRLITFYFSDGSYYKFMYFSVYYYYEKYEGKLSYTLTSL